MEKETEIYQKRKNKSVECIICPRRCQISNGQKGFCRTRENKDGRLNLITYGKAVAANIDPVEKKPFFNFAPGTRAFSISTVGCTLDCDFCQNAFIAKEWEKIQGENLPPEKVVRQAKRNQCHGIAYTYTEPTAYLEYCLDTMEETGKNQYNIFISNGYMTKETVEKIIPKLDAINIDLKGDKEFYQKHCKVPNPEPIKETIKKFRESDVFLEITCLIIPGENDSEEDIRERVRWLKENAGKETPIHFSRFYPARKMKDKKPTPIKTLEKALEIARDEGMEYVYCGNVPGHKSESTYCPECGEIAIKRQGYKILEENIDGKSCKNCGEELNIEGIRFQN